MKRTCRHGSQENVKPNSLWWLDHLHMISHYRWKIGACIKLSKFASDIFQCIFLNKTNHFWIKFLTKNLNGIRFGNNMKNSLGSNKCIPHDDVIKWKPFPRNWSFVRGIHRSPVNSPHKGQWRGALIFSLISAWVNNREAGDLRRHSAPIMMSLQWSKTNLFDMSGSVSCQPWLNSHLSPMNNSLSEIGARIPNCTHTIWWHVITQPCLNSIVNAAEVKHGK